MRNPWKEREPTGAELWDEAQRAAWVDREADRLMLWWWSFPGAILGLACGGMAVASWFGWF